MRLADAVYSERISRGWGQKDLALAARVSEALVRRLENEGSPPVSQAKRLQIALALGIQYDLATETVLSKHRSVPRRLPDRKLRITIPEDLAEHLRVLAEFRLTTAIKLAVEFLRQALQQGRVEISGEEVALSQVPKPPDEVGRLPAPKRRRPPTARRK